MEEEDNHLKKIKSQRPFLRSNFVNSSRQKRIKGIESGLVQNQPMSKPYPLSRLDFSKFKAPKFDTKPRKKRSRKVLFQKDEFTDYLEK